MDKSNNTKIRRKIISLLLLIVFSYSLSSPLIYGYKIKITPLNNNIFLSFPFTENITTYNSEIRSCDPDIDLNDNRCYISLSFFLSTPIKNISSLNCDLTTNYPHTKYFEAYYPSTQKLSCAWYFDAPSGANSCEDFLTGDFLFNLSSKFIANIPEPSNISTPWKINIYVWSCNSNYANCVGSLGNWKLCVSATNTTYTLVPNNKLNINKVYNAGTTYLNQNKIYAYPGDIINIEMKGKNIKDYNHGGKSLNSWINLTYISPHITPLSPTKVFVGNISSGASKKVNFTIKVNDFDYSWHPLTFNYSDSSGYYHATYTLDIFTTNLSIPYFAITSSQPIKYGNKAKFEVKTYGNATPIDLVKIEIYNSTNTYTITNTTPYSCTSNISCTYQLSSPPLPSGEYFVKAYAIDKNIVAINKTPQNIYSTSIPLLISYGKPKPQLILPKYYLLQNQSFTYNISIKSIDGDVQNATINLYSSKGKITYEPKKFFIKRLNNGSTIYLTGTINVSNMSEYEESTIIEVKYYAGNKTYLKENYTFDHLIIPIRIHIINNTQQHPFNIPIEFEAMISGNYTPLKALEFNITSLLFNKSWIIAPQQIIKNNTLECYNITDKYNKNIVKEGNISTNNYYDANLVRDNDLSTSWTGTTGDYILINFKNKRLIDKINMTSQSPIPSLLEISGDKDPLKDILIQKNKENTVLHLNEKTASLKFKVLNGSVSIYEIKVYPKIPNETCYIYKAYFLPPYSGNYTIIAKTQNAKGNKNFSVAFGKIAIQPLTKCLFTSKKDTIEINISATKGDLINQEISLESLNTSLANITSTPHKKIHLLKNEEYVIEQWNISIGNTNPQDLYLNLSINNQTSYIIKYPIIIKDITPPKLLGLRFLSKKANINIPYSFIAYINETIRLKNYTLTIYKNNKTINITHQINLPLYGNNITSEIIIPEKYLNKSNESIKIIGITLGDYNNTNYYPIQTTINTSNQLIIKDIMPYNIWNYNQKMIFKTLSQEYKEINNPKITLILESNDSIIYILHNITLNTSKIEFKPNYTLKEGNYTLRLKIYYKNNTGTISKKITITKELTGDLIAPAYPHTIAISKEFIPVISINYKNGEHYNTSTNIQYNESYILCYNNNRSITKHNILPIYSYPQYKSTLLFITKDKCYSPDKEGQFNIYLFLKDKYKNSINTSFTLYAIDPNKIKSLSSPPRKVITQSSGGEKSKIVYINKSNNTIKYIYLNESELEIFSFNLSTSYIELEQGKNKTLKMSIQNKANKRYNINLNINSSNIKISMPTSISLKEKEEIDIPIQLYIPLYVTPGTYKVIFLIKSKDVEMKKILLVDVLKNNIIKRIESINKSLNEINSKEISSLKKLGLYDSSIDKTLKQTQDLLKKAKKQIENNNIIGVTNTLMQLEKSKKSLDRALQRKKIQKFVILHKSEILFYIFIISSIISFSILFLFPLLSTYIKENRLTKKLEIIKQTMKQTELQYFKREIDETTFRNTMIKENEKINHILSQIASLRKEREYLLNINIFRYLKERKKHKITQEEIRLLRGRILS